MSDNICWYCKENPAHPETSQKVKFYKNVTSHIQLVGRKYRWEGAMVEIPQCERCYNLLLQIKNEVNRFGLSGIGGVIGFILGISLVRFSDLMLLPPILLLFTLPFVGVGIGVFIGLIVEEKFFPRKKLQIPDNLSRTDDFPAVKKLLEEGWKHGDRPPEVNESVSVQQDGKYFEAVVVLDVPIPSN